VRIGVDARRLTHGPLDGRLSYLKNGMQNILRLDSRNEYVFYVDGPLEIREPFNNRNASFHQLPYQFKQLDTVVNDWWRFERIAGSHNLTGFHLIVDPYPKVDTPYLISANDLTLYKRHFRGNLPLSAFLRITAWRQYNKLSFGDVARNARRIHCITHYMKDEFQEHLGIPDSRLIVIYPGGDNEHFRVIHDQDSLAEFRKSIGVNGDYIMAFGNKNLFVLLDAYARLPKSFRDSFSLVIAGRTFEAPRELDAMTSRLKISKHVVFANRRIPHDELVWFYNAASLFILPSQYEMFCNMIVEAMRCKCPVLASKLVPNVELGSDAIAYYEGVNDSVELSEAILHLLDSKDRRDQLAEAGSVRGSVFTWENYARAMLRLYEEAFS
jgi:glycosyltransferase involved in cell wall biosynthesis